MICRLIRLFLLVFLTLPVLASFTVARPMISIPEHTFDFGRVAQHAVVSHRFLIKSVGEDTLRITKVIPGCGCTKAPLKDSVLAPGDSTTLEILFSTKSYRGFLSKRPYLETNISEEKVYLKIKSELLDEPRKSKPVSLLPYKLDVSQFKPKPRLMADFRIINKDTVDYEIRLVDYADHLFDVTLPAVVKAGDSARGIVNVHESAIKTEFEHSLTFEINDKNKTRYSLPIVRKYRVRDRSGE
ncbi:MAG: DUF1573 domain-containing protein [candidate division Zixibacteria bacterium]|nr:DUF1573 domain-containing protein [candidate division Zixibacteria bacterium]